MPTLTPTSEPTVSLPPQLASEDDPRLVLLAREDLSGPAFRALYERHRERVYQFLLGLTREEELAEDALQETFFRVYQSLERYDPQRPFAPWLHRIARNAGLNCLRTRRKQGKLGQPRATVDRGTSDRVLKLVVGAEALDDARAALESLSDESRALLLQRHGLGLKLSELADSWEVTERTIRKRLHAAVDRLTAALVEHRARRGAR